MFTGIIEGVGKVKSVEKTGDGLRISVSADFDLERTNVGDSISVNGCCLTITSRLGKNFWADVSAETCRVSTLGNLKEGSPVNLERALQLGGRLGGHLVSGHIDGIAVVSKILKKNNTLEITFKIPPELSRYIVNKGSVAVDGVSLTVIPCGKEEFSVVVIPHTQLATTFSLLKPKSAVNLEVDIIGKYVEKLTLLESREYYEEDSKITEEFLTKHGF